MNRRTVAGRPAGRLRRGLMAAALAAMSLGLAVGLAEVAARALFPDWAPRTGRLANFWQYDPVVGWAHRPGMSGRFESFGFATDVHINRHGFRGPEHDYAPRPGVRRAVVLGDSFVWGFGVEERDSFTSLLQDKLGPGAEVINLGVSGYSNDQELLVYRNEGARYQPDLVILVVAANDVANNALPTAYVVYGKPLFVLGDDGNLTLTNQPVPETSWVRKALFDLASRSYLLNQLNRLRESSRVSGALDGKQGAMRDNPSPDRVFPRSYAEQLTIRLIEQTAREARDHGSRFLVVLVDQTYAGPLFGKALRERGLDVLELDPVLPADATDLHLPDQLHWTARGHRLVAEALEPRVRSLLFPAQPGTLPGDARAGTPRP